MKKLAIPVLLFCSFTFLAAQKTDTLTEVIKHYKTAEEVLGLPSIYTVLKCTILWDMKDYGMLEVLYAKDGSRWCINANSADFAKLWSHMVALVGKGQKITVNDITVQKGEKQFTLMPKSFIVP